MSLVYAQRGKITRAWKFASNSRQVAEQQKARYKHAQSLLVKAQLEKKMGDPTADTQIRIAQSRIDQIEGEVREAMQSGEADNGR